MNKVKVISFILLIVLLLQGRGSFTWTPWNRVVGLTSISVATRDTEGNVLVIDQSEKRVVKYDEEGIVLFELKAGKHHFNNAKGVVGDEEANTYVLDTILAEDGLTVEEQRIIQYDAQGKYKNVVYTHKYEESVKSIGFIKDLTYHKGSLFFIFVEPNHFQLIQFNIQENKHHIVREVPWENARLELANFAINENLQIAMSTKKGDIYKEKKQGEFELLYEGRLHGKNDQYSLPWELLYQEDKIYFTDLGLREIKVIDTKDYTVQTLYDSQGIVYRVGVDKLQKLCSTTGDNILIQDSATGAWQLIQEVYRSISDVIKSFGLLIGWGIVGVMAIWLAGKGLSYLLGVNVSDTLKIGIICLVMSGIITSIVANLIFYDMEKRYKEEVWERMVGIATFIASDMDKEAFEGINHPTAYMNEDYKKVRQGINHILDGSKDWNSGLYAVLYKVRNGEIYACMYQDDTKGAYYPFDWPYENSDEEKIYTTGEFKRYYGDFSNEEGSFMFALGPIYGDEGEVIGLIEVGTDLTSYVKARDKLILQISLNIISITIVLMLIFTEVLIFGEFLRDQKKVSLQDQKEIVHSVVVRPIIFIVFFASNMAAAFIPVYARELYVPFLGLPEEVVIALPISIEVLCCAISAFLGGYVIEKIGMKVTGIVGTVCFFLGLLLCAIAPDVSYLIIGNGISGIGSGLLLIVANTFIASIEDEEERNKGFAYYNAAFLAGLNSGVVIGSLLVNWMSHRSVFYIASMIAVATAYFTIKYIHIPRGTGIVEKEEKSEFGTFLRFLFTPRIIAFFICAMVPYLIFSYYLHYFFPIYGAENGLTDANIGQAFLMNGIWVIYLGPIVTRWLLKHIGSKWSIVVGSMIYIGALIYFALNQSIVVALITLVLLGIADSFTFTAHSVYYADLPQVERYGEAKAMGVYSMFENLGQAIGPIVYSVILMGNLQVGMMSISVIGIVLIVIFLQGSMKKRISIK